MLAAVAAAADAAAVAAAAATRRPAEQEAGKRQAVVIDLTEDDPPVKTEEEEAPPGPAALTAAGHDSRGARRRAGAGQLRGHGRGGVVKPAAARRRPTGRGLEDERRAAGKLVARDCCHFVASCSTPGHKPCVRVQSLYIASLVRKSVRLL